MMTCKLAEILEERGMPQYQLSIKTGIAESTISRLCNNNSTRLDLRVINKLMEYFEFDDLTQLFYWKTSSGK